jgi:hypothetical protein
MDIDTDKQLEVRLRDNPCRGIVLGMDPAGNHIQLAWIMGRSANSQNRIYVAEEGDIRTEAADPKKVEDPSLIIYTVMKTSNNAHIVSNGDQTDTVAEMFAGDNPHQYSFARALSARHCEPDAPVFTPRITGFYVPGLEHAYLSILVAGAAGKKKWIDSAAGIDKKLFKSDKEWRMAVDTASGLNHECFPTESHNFAKRLEPGVGYCFTTYRPGSRELPSFEGEPFRVPLLATLEESMLYIWEHLDDGNDNWRVAICGKLVKPDGAYRVETFNRHSRVE